MDFIDTLGAAFVTFFVALLLGFGLTGAFCATAVVYIVGCTMDIFRMRREILKLRGDREEICG